MPTDAGSRSRMTPAFGLTVQTSRIGFTASLSLAPFSVHLVTWTRRFRPRSYVLRSQTVRAGRFSWVRLRERTPSPRCR